MIPAINGSTIVTTIDYSIQNIIENAIKDFKGTVILVSHEPEFYEDIVTDIWDLEDWTTKIV
jgi:ATPase subunit of ABC transporter with duplicated ATPase domains